VSKNDDKTLIEIGGRLFRVNKNSARRFTTFLPVLENRIKYYYFTITGNKANYFNIITLFKHNGCTVRVLYDNNYARVEHIFLFSSVVRLQEVLCKYKERFLLFTLL
jgi:hypothetical protein